MLEIDEASRGERGGVGAVDSAYLDNGWECVGGGEFDADIDLEMGGEGGCCV